MVPDAVEHDPGKVGDILTDWCHRSISPDNLHNSGRVQTAGPGPLSIWTPSRDVGRRKRIGTLAEPNAFDSRSAIIGLGKPQVIATATGSRSIYGGRQVQSSENRLAPFNPRNASAASQLGSPFKAGGVALRNHNRV